MRNDQERELQNRERQDRRFEEMITSQIGLRWIFEAMCPQLDETLPEDLRDPAITHNLGATLHWGLPPIDMSEETERSLTADFEEMLESLKEHQILLVGHNMFLDLIYLYQAFIGPLPDEVEDFAALGSIIFPMVFDTKFLADALHDNDPRYVSSLQDLDRELQHVTMPVIGKCKIALLNGC